MKRLELPSIDTHATQDAHDVLEEARRSGTVQVLIGETGRGKTSLLRAYRLELSARYPERTPVLLHRGEVVNTPLSVLRSLLAGLDIEWSGTTHEAFPALVVEMKLQGVELIVVDDTQRLASHSLDMLRALHERTGVGIVMCGADRVREHLIRACPELAHRVVAVQQVPAVDDEDALSLVSKTPRLVKSLNFGDWLTMSRTLIEASGGNLRRMAQLLEEAQRFARSRHRALTPALLGQVATRLPDKVLAIERSA